MNAPWFRCHADAGDIKVVWRLADFLRTSAGLPQDVREFSHNIALGLLASFWGKASRFAPGGDVSGVSDGQIEEWAKWRGAPGVFAAWLREHHVTDGIINDYVEFNGVLDARRERDRQRKQEARKASAGRPQDVFKTSGRTKRDDTKNSRRGAKRGKSASPGAEQGAEAGGGAPDKPNWPALLVEDYRAIHGGELEYGEVGKTLKALKDRHGLDVLRPAWQAFCASPQAGFGARAFARDFAKYAPAAAAASVVAGSADPSHLPYSVRPAPADPRAELRNLRADWQGIRPPDGGMSRREWAGRQLDCKDWDRRYLHVVYPALAAAAAALPPETHEHEPVPIRPRLQPAA